MLVSGVVLRMPRRWLPVACGGVVVTSRMWRWDRWLGCVLIAAALMGVPALHPFIHSPLSERSCASHGDTRDSDNVHSATAAAEHDDRCPVCLHLRVSGAADNADTTLTAIGALVATYARPLEDALPSTPCWRVSRGRSPPPDTVS